jgi:mRNA-degrading endonuclease HigB of HigAB toxin-antitoxin module
MHGISKSALRDAVAKDPTLERQIGEWHKVAKHGE